jgi:hypothetical protein
MVNFFVVDTHSAYNVILRRKILNTIKAVLSLTFLKIKFSTSNGIREECDHHMTVRTCYAMSIKSKNSDSMKDKKILVLNEAFEIRLGEEIVLDPKDGAESKGIIELDDEMEEFVVGEGKQMNIGKALTGEAREDLNQFLIGNVNIFT